MTDALATLTQEELALLAPALNTFLTNLEQPNVNYLTVLEDAKNLQLSVLQLSGSAQATLINFVAAALKTKLNSLITPSSPPAA